MTAPDDRWLQDLDLYLDGELDAERERLFLEAVEQDPDLAARLGEEMRLTRSLEAVYTNAPVKARALPAWRNWPGWGHAAAAAVLLLMGGAIGHRLAPDAEGSGLTEWSSWAGRAQDLSGRARFIAGPDSRYEIVSAAGGDALRLDEGELWVNADAKRGLVVETPEGRSLLLRGVGRVTRVRGSGSEPLLLVSMQDGEARWLDDPAAEPIRGYAPTVATALGAEPVTRAVSVGHAIADGDDLIVLSREEFAFFEGLEKGNLGELEEQLSRLREENARLKAEAERALARADSGVPRTRSRLVADLESLAERLARSDAMAPRQDSMREAQQLIRRMRRAHIVPEEVVEDVFLGESAPVSRRLAGYRMLGVLGVPPARWSGLRALLRDDDPSIRRRAALTVGMARNPRGPHDLFLRRIGRESDASVRAAFAAPLIRVERLDPAEWKWLEQNYEAWSGVDGLQPVLVRAMVMSRAAVPTEGVAVLAKLILDDDAREGMRAVLLRRVTRDRKDGPGLLDPEQKRALLQRVLREARKGSRLWRMARGTLDQLPVR